MVSRDPILVARPDIPGHPVHSDAFGIVEKQLTRTERLYNIAYFRKFVILSFLVIAWEMGARALGNELLFPTFYATCLALFRGMVSGELLMKVSVSLQILVSGYAAGIGMAALLTAFAIGSRIGMDLLETMTAMFNPLPAIALLPIALIWFGLGSGSLIFVLVHSVLWAVALNTHTGFSGVSNTLRMVGRNCGLAGAGYVIRILVPAAFPSILAGLKIGWAFAWRTLIGSELVFGATSGTGGLGWYIYENKNQLDIPNVFAGLLTVIVIGLIVENLIFGLIEDRTVRKWGMQH